MRRIAPASAPLGEVVPALAVGGVTVIRTRTANVLVIGTGAAGLRKAIAAHQAGSHMLVVGKRPTLDAHTVLASGGINAALGTRDRQDSWQQFADTLRDAYFLSDPRVVDAPSGACGTRRASTVGRRRRHRRRCRAPDRVRRSPSLSEL